MSQAVIKEAQAAATLQDTRQEIVDALSARVAAELSVLVELVRRDFPVKSKHSSLIKLSRREPELFISGKPGEGKSGPIDATLRRQFIPIVFAGPHFVPHKPSRTRGGE